jgi:RNA polymerase sigma factor (sigma-70 family)
LEASALNHAGAAGLHARSPLLRLQSDERLIALVRRGNPHAFEALVARYQSRLLAFCRHMLASREDAEDVLQEVFAAAFNAILADGREINVRPWLYRIARNRSLNHLRRTTAIGVDSMDVHLSEHGETTADKVHRREEFRLLVCDVQGLPETQRTALLLREIDALSYEQIADAMETTVPSVKSLLVRARVALAEASEARLLTCEEVRDELGEVAEGLRRTSPPVRRHLRSCERCAAFRRQLRHTNRQLAVLLPVGPLLLVKKTLLAHLGTTAAAGGSTAAASAGAAAGGAAAGSALQAGVAAFATKAAAGLAAAAIVTAGAVEVKHVAEDRGARASAPVAATAPATPQRAAIAAAPAAVPAAAPSDVPPAAPARAKPARREADRHEAAAAKPASTPEPTATPTPVPSTSAGEGSTQHDGDTSTLPTLTTGSVQPATGGIPGSYAAGGQPPATAQPAQPAAGTPPAQPATTPQPEPTASPAPQSAATAAPAPEPSPEPSPDPSGEAVAPDG